MELDFESVFFLFLQPGHVCMYFSVFVCEFCVFVASASTCRSALARVSGRGRGKVESCNPVNL